MAAKNFEGHEPHMKLQPSGNQFPDYTAQTAASGNGSLPPGHPAFTKNERGASVTKRSFLKKVGD